MLSLFYSISLPNFHLMRIIYFMFFLEHLLLSEITICNENFLCGKLNLIPQVHGYIYTWIERGTHIYKPQLLNINDHAISSFYLQILSLHTTNIYVSWEYKNCSLKNDNSSVSFEGCEIKFELSKRMSMSIAIIFL